MTDLPKYPETLKDSLELFIVLDKLENRIRLLEEQINPPLKDGDTYGFG